MMPGIACTISCLDIDEHIFIQVVFKPEGAHIVPSGMDKYNTDQAMSLCTD